MRIVRILLAVLAAGVVLFFGLLAAIWRRPISTLDTLSKTGMRLSGLRRADIRSARGTVSVWSGGKGSTVVLLHGVNDSPAQWASVAGALMAEHRVILPELAGHGASAPAIGELTVGDLLEGVDAAIAAEAPQGEVALVGNSVGGWLALLWAIAHPDRARLVVLVNGAALSSGAGIVNMLPRDREEARRMYDALTGPAAPAPAGFLLDDLANRSEASPLARLMRSSYAPWRLDDRLSEVATPVVLLWGDADELLPVAYAQEVARRLPRARLELLPGCGHVPSRECPGLLLPRLVAALDSREDRVSGP
jgi:pimeloyl-ACP methyl ester carboxylesterase